MQSADLQGVSLSSGTINFLGEKIFRIIGPGLMGGRGIELYHVKYGSVSQDVRGTI